MYESFYGLKEKPFTLLPDPEYLYLSPKHQRALTLLEYGMMNQAGFSVICGDTGAGKTTLIRRLLTELGDDTTVGLITNTHQSFGELLNWVLMAFGIDADGKSKAQMHQMFISFLIEQYADSKHTVLIVDEAQNMNAATLEELRMLSNINADKDQVLQVILAGQPALRETLRQPELMQFAQRIAVDYYLESLSEEETTAYIQHRLKIAGAENDIFTPDACRAIYKYSGGTPRLINLLCDTSLVYGFAEQTPQINKQLVDDVVREQHSNSIVPTFNTSQTEKQTTKTSSAVDQLESKSVNAQHNVNDSVIADLGQRAAQAVSNLEAVANARAAEIDLDETITTAGVKATVTTDVANGSEAKMDQHKSDNKDSNVTPIKQDVVSHEEMEQQSSKATPEDQPAENIDDTLAIDESVSEPLNKAAEVQSTTAQQTKTDSRDEEVVIEHVEAEPEFESQKSSYSENINYEKAYPIIQVEDSSKKNINALVLGLAGGMFLASLMLVGYVVFSGITLNQPQQVQQMVPPVEQVSQLELQRRTEIEQARINAMQQERDAALALTKALERERDAAIASAKVQEEMRAAEQRAAEIIAEQERKTAIQITQARKRARQAELAAIRAEQRETQAREKAEQIRLEAEQARVEAARLKTVESAKQASAVAPVSVAQPVVNEEAISAPAEKPTVKKEPGSTKFSANPCNSPSAKFLSTCKK
ncbi:MAG: AAA family ATPase [Gammaproteobacteria bacterium]|nr:AAA family ATPase [Gammaproteobacteria bacterium]